MINKLDNRYTPYRKSYYTPKNTNVHGWITPDNLSKLPVSPLNILAPYTVNSLRELNLSPRYPKSPRLSNFLLPAVPKSASHSILNTPYRSRLNSNVDVAIDTYNYPNSPTSIYAKSSYKKDGSISTMSASSFYKLQNKDELLEGVTEHQERKSYSRDHLSNGVELYSNKNSDKKSLTSRPVRFTNKNLKRKYSDKKEFEQHLYEKGKAYLQAELREKDKLRMLNLSPKEYAINKHEKNLIY